MPDPYTTAAEFKARGIGRQESWSRWVQATSLRPGMDAKDWYSIYDNAEAMLPEVKAVVITPTHYDTLRQCNVEIHTDEFGVFVMQWADGGTGSNPPFLPPSEDRYIPIERS